MTLPEKYRITSFDGIVGYDSIKEKISRMIDNHNTQTMLFTGPPGCGKTTMAYAFASEYLGKEIGAAANHSDFEEINASNERGIDVIRGHVKSWGSKPASTMRGGVRLKRIMLLDEFDKTTPDAQGAFRVIMEKNQDTCIYILIGNHPGKIKEEALFSRCVWFKFAPQKYTAMIDWFKDISNKEGVEYESEDIILDILKHPEYEGDFRRILNDTLHKLVGIDHVVGKEDLDWIYRDSYRGLIDKMFKSGKFVKPFRNYYKKNIIDAKVFLRYLTKRIFDRKTSFKLAKTIADTEYRVGAGADDFVQIMAAMTGCELLL